MWWGRLAIGKGVEGLRIGIRNVTDVRHDLVFTRSRLDLLCTQVS